MAARRLTIIHFNDVYNIEPAAKEPVGGAARLVGQVGGGPGASREANGGGGGGRVRVGQAGAGRRQRNRPAAAASARGETPPGSLFEASLASNLQHPPAERSPPTAAPSPPRYPHHPDQGAG